MAPDENNNNNNGDAPKGTAKRRKRGGGGRNNRERKKLGPKGPPQTPQLKVTIRNIHNAEQNGTVRSVGERILRKLIQQSSEKLSSPDRITLQLDEAGFHALAEADDAARKAREEWKQKQDPELKVTESKEAGDEKNLADEPMEDNLSNVKSAIPSAVVEGMENLHISNSSMGDSTVHVRILYVVPPKMTKRRGEKTGCAYLVLTAPPIEAREPVQPQNLQADDTASTTRSVKSDSVSVQAPIDYSQDMARRRMMIQRTLEALMKTAEEDAKTRQEFSECVVAESLSEKTWKPRIERRDRLEGTMEETPDYKAFFEKSEQEKEERKLRPKPAPGGGVFSSSLASSHNNGDNNKGQPIAALVLHLRKKQEDEKKSKQQAKSNGKDGNNKVPSAKNDAGGTRRARQKSNAQKRKKKTSASATSKPSAPKAGSG